MTIWQPDLSEQTGPKYKAIAEALAGDIKNGLLPPGALLPTHRQLAETLGVTVGTVTRGYREGERRGLIRGQVGRGTYVLGGDERPGRSAGLFRYADTGAIDMGMNIPLYNEDPDLASVLGRLAKHSDLQNLLKYQPSAGDPRHRRAGVRWLEFCGLETSEDQVVITCGGQHAITALVLSLLSPGQTMLVEEYTYPGLKVVAEWMNIRLEPVSMDEDGLRPDSLEAACRRTDARALYVMPTLHNPTTATWPEERRRAVVEIARTHGLLIFEDDVHRPLHPDPPPPLAALAPERTFMVASTSKCLAGGLRVAYVAVPEGQVNRLSRAVNGTVWMAPPLMAEIATLWIEDGTAELVMARKRAEALRRQRLAAGILASFTRASHPNAYHLWLKLPEPWTAPQLAAQAEKQGVSVVPADTFAVGRLNGPPWVRVSLSAAPDHAALTQGLEILSNLMNAGPPLPPIIV